MISPIKFCIFASISKQHFMQLPEGKKIYFASDFHLGIPDRKSSIERELRLCKWFDEIKQDAAIIFLVGDLFDVWFEYKHVVPKGHVRFLGKLAELSDLGIQIEIFAGNHDLWVQDYFEDEMNIKVHHEPLRCEFNNKQFYIAHGDGLGPGDHGYKILKKIMTNKISQWLYRRLHPNLGISIATYFSQRGPKHTDSEPAFLGEENEWLMQFAKSILLKEKIDFFIFGHRHIALLYPIGESLYVNLGDWLRYNSYAVFDGEELDLLYFNSL